jgi:hypothetical protein
MVATPGVFPTALDWTTMPAVVDLVAATAGSETQPLHTLEFTRVASETNSVLVMDSNARMMFASVEAAAVLGYEPEQLMTMDATQLMPAPFNTLHSNWIKVRPDSPPSPATPALVPHPSSSLRWNAAAALLTCPSVNARALLQPPHFYRISPEATGMAAAAGCDRPVTPQQLPVRHGGDGTGQQQPARAHQDAVHHQVSASAVRVAAVLIMSTLGSYGVYLSRLARMPQ